MMEGPVLDRNTSASANDDFQMQFMTANVLILTVHKHEKDKVPT